MKDYRLSLVKRKKKVTTLYAESEKVVPISSLSLIYALHSANVGTVQRDIANNREIIELTQSAQKFKDADGKTGLQTILWHGPTRSPDKATYIRTYSDGKKEIWVELISAKDTHRAY